MLTLVSLGPRAMKRTSLAEAPKRSFNFAIVSAVSFLASDDFHWADASMAMAITETLVSLSLAALVSASRTLWLSVFYQCNC